MKQSIPHKKTNTDYKQNTVSKNRFDCCIYNLDSIDVNNKSFKINNI